MVALSGAGLPSDGGRVGRRLHLCCLQPVPGRDVRNWIRSAPLLGRLGGHLTGSFTADSEMPCFQASLLQAGAASVFLGHTRRAQVGSGRSCVLMQCSPSSMGPVGWVTDDMLLKEQHDSVYLQRRADGTPRAVTCQCVFDSWVSR